MISNQSNFYKHKYKVTQQIWMSIIPITQHLLLFFLIFIFRPIILQVLMKWDLIKSDKLIINNSKQIKSVL